MRLLLKVLSLPIIFLTWILYGVCRLLVIASGAVLGVLSGMLLAAAAVLFFKAGVIPCVVFLVIAFIISPYGLPKSAAWLTGKLGGLNHALRDFVLS